MDEDAERADRLLAEQFEQHRPRLRRAAAGLLGSADEADDAVQEAWLRLQRTGAAGVDDLAAWLTTVVGRVCLDALRRRAVRREQSLDDRTASGVQGGRAPEDEAVLADALGLALAVVLDALTPPERLAFVLHDVFAVPFDEVAAILDRSPAAARQLASRARRRVQGAAPDAPSATDAGRQGVVRAFLRAARDGDLPGLVAVLDPDVVLRADGAVAELGGVRRLTGAPAVAGALLGRTRSARLALVDGVPGAVFGPDGRLRGALELVVTGGRVVAVDVVTDPAVLEVLDVTVLDEPPGP